MSPLSKKRGHHDLRILRFGGLASTAAVRTRGDFGIIPSPCDIDAERKMRSKAAAKIYEQSMCESLARKLFWELESFATRCEALLPCDRERCIIRTIFVAGGRTEIDILEPHNPEFKDNLGKAKGFAEYARQNPGVGRIQLIRMGTDSAGNKRFKRLDMSKSAVRDKVSHAMSNDELDHIFDTDGFIAQ